MSLTKEAIQHIETQALAAAQVFINPGSSNLAVLPEAVSLRHLEPYQALRDRFRGALATHALADFATYVEAHGKDAGARGFVNQDAMSATVIFNLGDQADPGHGDDTATLTLKPTAAYSALQAIVGKKLDQQGLAEWLEDWAPHLAAKAHDADLGLAAAINGVRKMTIKESSQRDHSVGDLSARRSATDEIEARSQEILPTTFIFTTPPFEGLQPANITLRLSVITSADAPILKLRWVGEEAQREEFAREFKGVLEREVGGFVPLTIGAFTVGK